MMALELYATKEHETASDCRSTGLRVRASSSSAANDARQKGGAANRRLSRLHSVGVRVRVNSEWSPMDAFSHRLPLLHFLKTGAGCGLRPFSRIQIGWFSPSRRPVRCPSRCVGQNLPGRAVMAAPGTFNSSRNRACKPFARNSLPDQHLSQCLADRLHHQTLSSSLVSAGFNNASTRGQSVVHLTQKRGA